jgi:hypothetical protein
MFNITDNLCVQTTMLFTHLFERVLFSWWLYCRVGVAKVPPVMQHSHLPLVPPL